MFAGEKERLKHLRITTQAHKTEMSQSLEQAHEGRLEGRDSATEGKTENRAKRAHLKRVWV